jgi:methionine synthase I (cobalamin-dependent)
MWRLLEILQSGHVLLMDGAMGTELQRAGIGENECYELWNLTRPESIRDIHQRYVSAGADCLLTNTFQANPRHLAKHGVQDALEEINYAAISLARSVAGKERFVIGDVGPIAFSRSDNAKFLDRVISSLSNADAILLETWSDRLAPLSAQRAKRSAINKRGIPVFLSIAYQHGSSTEASVFSPEPEVIAILAQSCGIDALGVNCGRDIGLEDVIAILRRYRKVTSLPLFARPNAGTPTQEQNRWLYPQTPEKMASRLTDLLEAGVSMLGGCCGTTPEHIAAFRPIVEEWNKRRGSTEY